jgi:branched-chain amino acid transport system ATP-binding protein
LRYADYGYVLENGRIVLDGAAADLKTSRNSTSGSTSGRKSYREVKHYRRRKRWLA